MADTKAVSQYWGREGLGQAILDALAAAGKDIDALTVEDLAPMDQFHGGGEQATERLARLAGLTPETRVLDVGGGLGGPARTLAAHFGCRVTVVDLTESYVLAGERLTRLLGLQDRVTHWLGHALELAAEDEAFDVVWTQNSGMNVPEKGPLYAGLHRVLRAGGLLALQEPMAGPVQPPIYPVMWARDAAGSFLSTPAEMRTAIERAGFVVRVWDDLTMEMAAQGTVTLAPELSIQRLVMGDRLEAISRNGDRNRDEGRIVMVQAVFERV